MNTIKNLVIVLASCFGISLMDGLFGWGISETGFIVFVGLTELTCIIWLLILVCKKQPGTKGFIEKLKEDLEIEDKK